LIVHFIDYSLLAILSASKDLLDVEKERSFDALRMTILTGIPRSVLFHQE